jgi:hypothetical protein
MMMTFQKYADNKFMSTNAAVELDIEVVADGFGVYFVLSSAFDKYQFESFEKAVRFAEHKYGVRNVFEVIETEDEYYERMFMQDSDGYATLGGQI